MIFIILFQEEWLSSRKVQMPCTAQNNLPKPSIPEISSLSQRKQQRFCSLLFSTSNDFRQLWNKELPALKFLDYSQCPGGTCCSSLQPCFYSSPHFVHPHQFLGHFCQRKHWWFKNLAQNFRAAEAINISHCSKLICFPYGIFNGVWKIHKWNNNYKWGILWEKKCVFLPMHHLKGFLIKSILDYAGDDIGCQITVCWVLFSGKDCSQGQ